MATYFIGQYVSSQFASTVGTSAQTASSLSATGIAVKVILHALAGGIHAKASGGSFKDGALAAGVSAFVSGKGWAGPDGEMSVQGLIVSALVGGTVSRLSGGKFANGAFYGFMTYILNQATEKEGESATGDFVNSLGDDQKALYKTLVNSQGTSRSEVKNALKTYDDLVTSLSADQVHLFAQAIGIPTDNLLSPSFGDPSKAVSVEYLNSSIRMPLVRLQYKNAWKAGGVAAGIVYNPGAGTTALVKYVATLKRAEWIGTAFEGYGHLDNLRKSLDAME